MISLPIFEPSFANSLQPCHFVFFLAKIFESGYILFKKYILQFFSSTPQKNRITPLEQSHGNPVSLINLATRLPLDKLGTRGFPSSDCSEFGFVNL